MNCIRFAAALVAFVLSSCATAPEPRLDPNQKSFFVDVEYTIGRDGKTKDARILSTDAPKQLQKEALQEVRRHRADPSVEESRARRRIEFSLE